MTELELYRQWLIANGYEWRPALSMLNGYLRQRMTTTVRGGAGGGCSGTNGVHDGVVIPSGGGPGITGAPRPGVEV